MEGKNNIYIKALKYGTKHETFSLNDLTESLNLTNEQKTRLSLQISQRVIFHFDSTRSYYRPDTDTLSMSVEDTFRLLEYTELKEARRSSKVATYFASAALVISIISTLASIYYSHKSMEAKTVIPVKQGSTIKK